MKNYLLVMVVLLGISGYSAEKEKIIFENYFKKFEITPTMLKLTSRDWGMKFLIDYEGKTISAEYGQALEFSLEKKISFRCEEKRFSFTLVPYDKLDEKMKKLFNPLIIIDKKQNVCIMHENVDYRPFAQIFYDKYSYVFPESMINQTVNLNSIDKKLKIDKYKGYIYIDYIDKERPKVDMKELGVYF